MLRLWGVVGSKEPPDARTLEKGLSLKLTMGSIITLTPALTISEGEMDRALDIVDECLTEVERT